MPTTVNSDLIIYDDLAQTAFLERRQDNLEVFNAASNGAIILDNELIEGDFRKRTFYKVGGSIESRNVNSTDPVTGKKIGAGESVSVKAPWKYGPYETTEEAFVVVKFFWTRRSDGRVMHRRATGRQGWPAFRTVRVIGSQVLNAIGYCYKS